MDELIYASATELAQAIRARAIFQRRCRECKGYFGIEAIDSRKVDEKVYETKTETRIERIYRNTYRCMFCGDTNTINEHEYERIPTE